MKSSICPPLIVTTVLCLILFASSPLFGVSINARDIFEAEATARCEQASEKFKSTVARYNQLYNIDLPNAIRAFTSHPVGSTKRANAYRHYDRAYSNLVEVVKELRPLQNEYNSCVGKYLKNETRNFEPYGLPFKKRVDE